MVSFPELMKPYEFNLGLILLEWSSIIFVFHVYIHVRCLATASFMKFRNGNSETAEVI